MSGRARFLQRGHLVVDQDQRGKRADILCASPRQAEQVARIMNLAHNRRWIPPAETEESRDGKHSN